MVKTAAGVSLASVIGFIIHAVHLYHVASTTDTNDFSSFKKAKATIILTDSAGSKDTLSLDDYLQMEEEKRRELYQNSLNNVHSQEESKQLQTPQ